MPGRQHAAHNESLCDLIHSTGKYPDWVVTTAYYSAIYYIDNQIFPLTVGQEPVYATFNQFLNRNRGGGKPHEIRLDLVNKHLPECTKDLTWLFETCDGARYNRYNGVTPEIATMARDALQRIKKVCKKP